MSVIEINVLTGEQIERPYTQEELDAISNQPAPPQPSPAEQIAALEQQYMLPRVVREFLLSTAELEASKQGITPEQLYAANVGYRRVKDLDNQIRELRAQL